MWLSFFLNGVIGNARTIAVVVITAWVTYHLTVTVTRWNMESEKAAIKEQCETEKLKTKEANDALQKSQSDIAARLAMYKRVQSNCNLSISTKPTSGGYEYARSDGRIIGTSDDFRDYAAECETYRQQRIILEELLK